MVMDPSLCASVGAAGSRLLFAVDGDGGGGAGDWFAQGGGGGGRGADGGHRVVHEWRVGDFVGYSVAFPGGPAACEALVAAVNADAATTAGVGGGGGVRWVEADDTAWIEVADSRRRRRNARRGARGGDGGGDGVLAGWGEAETVVQGSPPWNLDRLDQRSPVLDGLFHVNGRAGHGVDIYVVDTGVRVDHVDFGGRAQWGVTTRTGSPDEDDNGHGSHVAGTAAGLVSGVAKRANVIAVKVLDAAGHGPYSELIEGLAWVANRTRTTGRPSIVNLSIQGRPSNVLNRALAGLTRLGIHVTSAAGNMGADACRYSPASATREASAGGGGGGGAAIVSVGATDGRDALAGFSNYGECVSVYAPGVDVASVFADSVNQYVELSGTSMASPLVAGAVAVLLSEQRGGGDGAGEVDTPMRMKRRLLRWAEYRDIAPRDEDGDSGGGGGGVVVDLEGDGGGAGQQLVAPIVYLAP